MTVTGIIQIVLMFLAGFILQALFARKEKPTPFGLFVFLSLVSSVMMLIIIGFLLELPNRFSILGIIIIEYLFFAGVLIYRFIKIRSKPKGKKQALFAVLFPVRLKKPSFRLVYIPFIILFLILCRLYWRPAEYVHGGFDPGIYINSGINLSNTGSPFFTDKTVSDMGYERARRYLGMFTINPLGVAIIHQFEGRMASQFYPGLPVLYAAAYGTAGYDHFLYIQPLIALLSLFALYYFISAVFGKMTGALAVALYSFNLITVWFARYPVAEPLTVLMISAGLYLLLTFHVDGGVFRSVAGGLMTASAMIVRPDAALALFAVSLIGLYRYIWKKWKPGEGWFFVSAFAGFAASLFYAVFYTGGYLRGVFISFIGVGAKKERALAKAGILSLLIAAALILLLVALKRRDKIASFLKRFRRIGVFLPTAAACMLLSLVIFQFFIRPALPFAFLSPQDNSLVRLGWYFAPLGIGWDKLQSMPPLWSWILLKSGVLFAALCAAYAVEKARDYKKVFFNLLWIPFALLYFQDLRIEPQHFWLNRRYLMFILIGMIVSIWTVLIDLWRNKTKAGIVLKIFVAVLLAFYTINFALGTQLIERNKEWKGMRQNLACLNASFPAKAMIIIDGSDPHTLEPLHLPLMTFFGRNVGTLKNNSIHLDSLPIVCERLAELYGDVIYLTPESGRAPRIPGVWGLVGTQKIETKLFETPYVLDYRPPAKAVGFELPVNAYIFASRRLRAGNRGFTDIGSEGDIFLTGKWFARESAEGITFRWSGGTAGFVTWLEKDAKYIELNAASGRIKGVPPAQVTLLVNGREIASFTADPLFKTYRFTVPPGIHGDIELTVRTDNPWRPSDYAIPDNRKLGLKIDSISIN